MVRDHNRYMGTEGYICITPFPDHDKLKWVLDIKIPYYWIPGEKNSQVIIFKLKISLNQRRPYKGRLKTGHSTLPLSGAARQQTSGVHT